MVEEWEILHFTEPSEIDVRALLLHLHHFLNVFLHGFHFLFVGIGVHNAFHGVVFAFFYSESVELYIGIFHDVGHDVAFYFCGIALGVHATEHLFLKVQEVGFMGFVVKKWCQQRSLFIVKQGVIG